MPTKKVISIKSSTDELKLFANIYIPDAQPKAVVQIIHGMAEHKERYEQLCLTLAKCGYVTIIADNRGHGKSVNDDIVLGYFAKENGWLVNLQDIHNFSLYIREKYRNLPFFVIGHSMGSLIGHSYLKRYEDIVDGIIFSGMPAYNNATNFGKSLATFFKKGKGAKKCNKILISASDYNKAYKHPRTPFDWLSYNEENVDKYVADPLCGYPFTNSGMYDLLDGMQDVYQRKDWRILKKELPILFIAGKDDLCADVPKGFNYALNNLASAGYNNIKANIYQDMKHEIFNESDKITVYKDVIKWLDEQLKLRANSIK